MKGYARTMYVSGTGGALREPVHGTWVAVKNEIINCHFFHTMPRSIWFKDWRFGCPHRIFQIFSTWLNLVVKGYQNMCSVFKIGALWKSRDVILWPLLCPPYPQIMGVFMISGSKWMCLDNFVFTFSSFLFWWLFWKKACIFGPLIFNNIWWHIIMKFNAKPGLGTPL